MFSLFKDSNALIIPFSVYSMARGTYISWNAQNTVSTYDTFHEENENSHNLSVCTIKFTKLKVFHAVSVVLSCNILFWE